jgi:hypothetical protein
MSDMPRDIWVGFDEGYKTWNLDKAMLDDKMPFWCCTNTEMLIKELEEMKIPMTPKRYGRTINATIDAVIKKVRGE